MLRSAQRLPESLTAAGNSVCSGGPRAAARAVRVNVGLGAAAGPRAMDGSSVRRMEGQREYLQVLQA